MGGGGVDRMVYRAQEVYCFAYYRKKKQRADPPPVWMGLYTKPVPFSW